MAGDGIEGYDVVVGRAAVDRETGLEQYEGDEKIYADILENFAKNNISTLRKLQDATRAGDKKLAHRTAHSLRGAAGAIGAARLASAALSIENTLSAKSGAESDFAGGKGFNELMMLLEREFNAVFDELKAHVVEKEGNPYHPGAMNREKAVKLIERLAPFLETGDAKCLEYLDELEEVFLPAAEGFKLFITNIESYDFEQAYEVMESIRRFIMP